jgi:hypothetical protein
MSTEECKPKILASCAVQGLVRSCPPGMEVRAGKRGILDETPRLAGCSVLGGVSYSSSLLEAAI